MQKYFKMAPLYSLLFYAMVCYGYYAFSILYRVIWFAVKEKVGYGITTSIVLGVTAAFLVAAFRVFFKRGQYFLGMSFVYAGTFVCCWLNHFGVPLLGRYPRHFSIGSDYSILFITTVSLLALHFAVRFLKKWISTHRGNHP